MNNRFGVAWTDGESYRFTLTDSCANMSSLWEKAGVLRPILANERAVAYAVHLLGRTLAVIEHTYEAARETQARMNLCGSKSSYTITPLRISDD